MRKIAGHVLTIFAVVYMIDFFYIFKFSTFPKHGFWPMFIGFVISTIVLILRFSYYPKLVRFTIYDRSGKKRQSPIFPVLALVLVIYFLIFFIKFVFIMFGA
jgi:hypothetical protein